MRHQSVCLSRCLSCVILVFFGKMARQPLSYLQSSCLWWFWYIIHHLCTNHLNTQTGLVSLPPIESLAACWELFKIEREWNDYIMIILKWLMMKPFGVGFMMCVTKEEVFASLDFEWFSYLYFTKVHLKDFFWNNEIILRRVFPPLRRSTSCSCPTHLPVTLFASEKSSSTLSFIRIRKWWSS